MEKFLVSENGCWEWQANVCPAHGGDACLVLYVPYPAVRDELAAWLANMQAR